MISLHLGSGASVAAIRNGESIDTTMGLTPLEGLPGATRSGSIDPSLVFHYTSDASSLARSSTKELHISVAEEILNKRAGWHSMVGTTDFWKVVQGTRDGNEKMKLVFDMFVDRIVGYVGNYFVKLGGKVDALTFSGGIGEKSEELRKAVVEKVACLGFKLDDSPTRTSSSGAVTKLGPNVLLVKTNVEVRNSPTPCEENMVSLMLFHPPVRDGEAVCTRQKVLGVNIITTPLDIVCVASPLFCEFVSPFCSSAREWMPSRQHLIDPTLALYCATLRVDPHLRPPSNTARPKLPRCIWKRVKN